MTTEVKVRVKGQGPAAPETAEDTFPEMVGETAAMTDKAPEPEPVKPEPAPVPEKKLAEKDINKVSLGDLSADQLRFLLEQKLIEEAKKAEESGVKMTPPSKAPRGMMWVFNRSPQRFEFQHDSVIYQVEGHDLALFPENIARHGRKRSILSIDPLANTAVFKLALEGEPKFGVPLRVVNRTELLDRSTGSNIMGRGAPVKTHAAAISVAGVAELLSRRDDTLPEFE